MAEPVRKKNGRFIKKSTVSWKQNLGKNPQNTVLPRLPKLRVVDCRHFLTSYDGGCKDCGCKFTHSAFIKESRYGLASILHFKCSKCFEVTTITTSKRCKSNRNFAINVKTAIAMISVGIGATHVNAFLAAIGLPTIHQKTMKRLERIVGKVMRKQVAESCNNARILESSLTLNIDEPVLKQTCSDKPLPQSEPQDDSTKVSEEIIYDDSKIHPHKLEDSSLNPGVSNNEIILQHSKPCEDTVTFEEAMSMLDTSEDTDTDTSILIEKSNHNLNVSDEIIYGKPSTTINKHDSTFMSERYSIVTECSGGSSTQTSGQEDPNAPLDNYHDAYKTPISYPSASRQPVHVPRPSIIVSQDVAWSKRGRAMNSNSGWGHVIGLKTKKCLDFTTRVKVCATCDYYERNNKPVKPHDCRKNWTHSAKSMEPDIAVELHENAKNRGMLIDGMISDGDSSSLAHVRKRVNPNVEKFTDLGHEKRIMRRKLEDLQKNNKLLTQKVRESFLKNFSYAVKQNCEKSEEDLIKALTNIVPHMFGTHIHCGEWCKQHDSNSLKDPQTRIQLENLLAKPLSNAASFLTYGSSQVNESLNNIAWSKCPKSRNYNKSESFDARMDCAVLQFNEGHKWIHAIGTEFASPIKESQTYFYKKDLERKRQAELKSKPSAKKRRLEKKKCRFTKEETHTLKEGVTYQSGCESTLTEIDLITIPDEQEWHVDHKDLIYLDLETTGLGPNAEITQLAAQTFRDGELKKYSTYVLPKRNISLKATEISGIYVRYKDGHRHLFKNGTALESVDCKTALLDFMKWVQSLNIDSPIIAAHNGRNFDFKVLLNALYAHEMIPVFKTCVSGFLDTLVLLRRERPGYASYSLSNLHRSIFSSDFEAHDAVEDVACLCRIIEKTKITSIDISKHVFGINAMMIKMKQSDNVKELTERLSKHGVSKYTINKIASTGLTYKHLEMANIRNPKNGLFLLLSERNNLKKFRVTNNIKIIENIKKSFSLTISE